MKKRKRKVKRKAKSPPEPMPKPKPMIRFPLTFEVPAPNVWSLEFRRGWNLAMFCQQHATRLFNNHIQHYIPIMRGADDD